MPTGFGLIDYVEAARLLGLSKDTLRRYVSCRKLPFYKIGTRVFFDPEELRTWVYERKVSPI